MSLEEQIVGLNERLSAQESHYEGIRSAILELRRDLVARYSGRDTDLVALRQQVDEVRQRVGDLEKTITSGLADVHRSFQMLLDRRDITLLQRSVNETIKRVQAVEEGQKELRGEIQDLRKGQEELRAGQQQMQQVLQQILAKLG
jgi:predicted  nucleic acid-binding Zn-ribbon protein